MRLGKIALWIFIAILISGIMFGFSFFSDVSRMGGWDKFVFGVGEQYSINDSDEKSIAGIKRIEVSVSSTDTNIQPSQNENVSALLSGVIRTTNPATLPHLEMTVSGDTMTIKEVRNTTFVVGFYSSNVSLNIAIPESFQGELVFDGSSGNFNTQSLNLATLRLNVSSGDLKLGTINLASEFYAKTSSGNITIDSLRANSVYMESSSGDKEIKEITTKQDVTSKSSSGKTVIDRIDCNKLYLEASSGDIKVDYVRAQATSANSSSGKIEINGSEGDATIQTSSGDLSLKCDKPNSEIALSCTSGTLTLSLPSDIGFTLDAATSSGRISSQLALEETHSDEDNLRGRSGTGEVKINLRTSSGDIRINKN